MSDEEIVKTVGQVSELGTTVMNRISGAIGAVFEPYQIRRIAHAGADARRILAQGEVDATDILVRAQFRRDWEAIRHQEAIEDVVHKALPHITDGARPEQVEDDWLIRFFGIVEDITDDQMRTVWSKILAGEFNSPRNFSRRTLSIAAELDKSDLILSTTICGFSVVGETGGFAPVILEAHMPIYENAGLNYLGLKEMAGVGLINYDGRDGFATNIPKKNWTFKYFGELIDIEFTGEPPYKMGMGSVMMTVAGKELQRICTPELVPEFPKFLKALWTHSDPPRIVTLPWRD